MYLTLPLRMRGITVNLIVQHLDTEKDRLTLQTFTVHLKIRKESTFLDVKNSVDELLQDSGLCSVIVFCICNPMTHSLMVVAVLPHHALYSKVNYNDQVINTVVQSNYQLLLLAYAVHIAFPHSV